MWLYNLLGNILALKSQGPLTLWKKQEILAEVYDSQQYGEQLQVKQISSNVETFHLSV